MSEQLREDLEAALAVISEPGSWCKDALELDGKHCAMGAVLVACEGNARPLWLHGREDPRILAATRALRGDLPDAPEARLWGPLDEHGHNWSAVVAFNNAPETSHEDVRELFRKAIKRVVDEQAG